jgi:vacuolar protein sorting-associated protein 35
MSRRAGSGIFARRLVKEHERRGQANRCAVITKVFPDEYHLHTLDKMLSAIARLNPHVDMKKIVIGLMDRLSTYAQRESAEGISDEDKRKAEEDAAIRMLEKIDLNQDSKPAAPAAPAPDTPTTNGTEPKSPTETQTTTSEPATPITPAAPANGESAASVGEVKLFEIFYEQVVSLVKTRGLPIQDTMALLTSLANLALYVLQVSE